MLGFFFLLPQLRSVRLSGIAFHLVSSFLGCVKNMLTYLTPAQASRYSEIPFRTPTQTQITGGVYGINLYSVKLFLGC